MVIAPLLLASIVFAQPVSVKPAFATQSVSQDADDPAIWVHPTEPSKSLILGTDKVEKVGGLYVFNLEGKVVQHIPNIDRPNNVDVQKGFWTGSRRMDIVVLTERMKSRLRIFAVDPVTTRLREVSGSTLVLQDREGEGREPMGIGLRGNARGEVWAVVSPKTGPSTGYLGIYRLIPRGDKVDVVPAGSAGTYSGKKEIESVLVDDALDRILYSDETFGNRWIPWGTATPPTEALNTGFKGDHEGIALYEKGRGGVYVFTNQMEGGSEFTLIDRRSWRVLGVVNGGSDDTDGIEVTSAYLGPRFPKGILVAMNSKDRNFLVYDWRDIKKALNLR
jgi:3-phytase